MRFSMPTFIKRMARAIEMPPDVVRQRVAIVRSGACVWGWGSPATERAATRTHLLWGLTRWAHWTERCCAVFGS